MTVDSKYVIKQYTADGGDTYTFDTESIGEAAIQVWVIIDDVRVQYTSSLYDLTFDNSHSPIYKRGTVKFDAAVIPVEGQIVSIERGTPIVNELTLVDGEPFPSEQFEHMMDRICFIQQEIEGHYCDCRAICTPPAITVQPYELLDPAYTFTFEATGTGPLAYQWQEDNAGDGVFVDMVGETNIQLTVPDTSTNQYRVVVTNACGTAISDPTILENPEPTNKCNALDLIFNEITGLWFLWRGYKSDITGAFDGEYSGGIPNIAIGSPHPTDGTASFILATDRLQAGWVNCTNENLWYFNGNNTGNGATVNHRRDSTQTPSYVGAGDAHIQGGMFRPGLTSENPSAGGPKGMGKFGYKTFIYADPGMRWDPLTGRVSFYAGWATSQGDEEVYLDCGGTDPNFLGYDLNNPDTATNRIWRFVAWRIIKTNSDITITIWKDGVEHGPYNTTQTVAGTQLSNEDWWITDDGSASRDPRQFAWGMANNSRRDWWITFAFVGDPNMDTSRFPEIKAALDEQLAAQPALFHL